MTLNCNGIRADARKGFFDWLPEADVDVVCLQETKEQVDQLRDPVFYPASMTASISMPVKRGFYATPWFPAL